MYTARNSGGRTPRLWARLPIISREWGVTHIVLTSLSVTVIYAVLIGLPALLLVPSEHRVQMCWILIPVLGVVFVMQVITLLRLRRDGRIVEEPLGPPRLHEF